MSLLQFWSMRSSNKNELRTVHNEHVRRILKITRESGESQHKALNSTELLLLFYIIGGQGPSTFEKMYFLFGPFTSTSICLDPMDRELWAYKIQLTFDCGKKSIFAFHSLVPILNKLVLTAKSAWKFWLLLTSQILGCDTQLERAFLGLKMIRYCLSIYSWSDKY